MINVNECRVGNWVKCPSNDFFKYCQVTARDFSLIDFWENCSGIPLSPEILEKAGFDQVHDDDSVFCHDNLPCYLWYGTGNPDGSDTGYYLSESVYRSTPISKNMPYLHQLQNLYHSLTGHELNIQL